MICGIHHVSLIVTSEASIEFYTRIGFHEITRITRKNDTVVLMEGHSIGLEIYIDGSHPQRGNPEPIGMRNLSLKVDCLEKTTEELNLQAGPIMTDWRGERFCFITDPDGLLVQLHEERKNETEREGMEHALFDSGSSPG